MKSRVKLMLAAALIAGLGGIAQANAYSAAAAAAPSAKVRKSAGPGLGLSKAEPEGAPFKLPPGITLEDPILAYASQDPIDCEDKYPEEGDPSNNGGAVTLCLVFRNTTGQPITVTLPPGLLFVSKSDKVQSGFTVQTVRIVVPAGERYFSPLHLHCANVDRNLSSRNDEYKLGPIVQYEEFNELFTLLEGKTVTRDELAYVQLAVRHLTNGEGLSAEDRAALKAM